MKAHYDFPLRLQAYIAKSSTLSRRKAEEAILAGRVEVNDSKVTTLGTKVEKSDKVYLDGELLSLEPQSVVYMLNKPSGCVCTDDDPHAKKLAKDYLVCKEHDILSSVGRLDKDSMGLLLFTNDGELANSIIHPSKKIEKTYSVRVTEKLNIEHLKEMTKGVLLPDNPRPYKIERFAVLTSHWVELVLADGKNREIRKLFEHFNYNIEKLIRLKIGKLDIGELAPGKFKKLNGEDIKKIFD